MTPTQAQIEALKVAIKSRLNHGFYGQAQNNDALSRDLATIALTLVESQTSVEFQQNRGAAWDIIDQAITDYNNFMLDDDYDAQDTLNKIIHKLKERRSYYTAAAEAGEDKSTYVEALNFAHAYERGSKEATAATIERCAQVAEARIKNGYACDAVAAIRALKDSK